MQDGAPIGTRRIGMRCKDWGAQGRGALLVKGVELTGTEFVTRVRDTDQIGRKGFASLGEASFWITYAELALVCVSSKTRGVTPNK